MIDGRVNIFICLDPSSIILNSTSSGKIICMKEKDDDRDFEFNTSSNILSQQIIINSPQCNKTFMEITINSFGYIGFFHLFCFSTGDQSHGVRGDVIIGSKYHIIYSIFAYGFSLMI